MSRESMLTLIKKREAENTMGAHLDRMGSNQSNTSPKNYLALVDEFMAANPDISKAMAMRAITAKHPRAHEAWIREVNSQK